MVEQDKESEFLTLEEFAKFMRFTYMGAYRMVREKRIPAFKVGGSQILQMMKIK
jgi:excisionase family DNA binding protein